MKMVKCFDCNEELKFIDAKPLWNRLDKEPDFLCSNCIKDVPRCDDELALAKIISKLTIKNNQPERSKREDLERGCGALNSMET